VRAPLGLLFMVRAVLAALAPRLRPDIQRSYAGMSLVTYTREPVLSWRAKERQWCVEVPFTAIWRGYAVKIPMGFRTDLASIPQLFRSLIPQVGRHIQPAIVHDILYRHPWTRAGISRAMADRMFLDGMETVEVGWALRWAMYGAVRAGGWASWTKGER